MMVKVVVYSKDYCPYCVKAKNLLAKKGVAFEEIDITNDLKKQEEMLAKAEGRRTVPQIFINDKPIGGYDDLQALDSVGRLDPLLKA
jgi:glutaredoxin 3